MTKRAVLSLSDINGQDTLKNAALLRCHSENIINVRKREGVKTVRMLIEVVTPFKIVIGGERGLGRVLTGSDRKCQKVRKCH